MNTTHVTNLEVIQLDKQRLRCTVTLSDNHLSPELIIEVTGEQGNPLASLTILESPDLENSYVIHLPSDHNSTFVNVNVYLKSDTLGIINQEKTRVQLGK